MGHGDPNARPALPRVDARHRALQRNAAAHEQRTRTARLLGERLGALKPPRQGAAPQREAQNAKLNSDAQNSAVQDYVHHAKAVLKRGSDSPQHDLAARTMLAAEITNAGHDQIDQARLRQRAFDHTQTDAKRLSATRELRVRYGIPVSPHDLRAADLKRKLVPILKRNARENARDYNSDEAAAASSDTNPLHPFAFLHTVGLLNTISAKGAAGILAASNLAGQVPGQMDLTPKVVKKYGSNALKDLIDLPAQTVVGAADTIHAGWQFEHGHPKEAKDLAKSTLHLLEHPSEHPLVAALITKGGVSGLDHAVGRGLRTVGKAPKLVPEGTATDRATGLPVATRDLRAVANDPHQLGSLGDETPRLTQPGVRGKLGAIGSTHRAPGKLYSDKNVARRYSAGPLGKHLQILAETHNPAKWSHNRGAAVKEAQQAVTEARLAHEHAVAEHPEHDLSPKARAAFETWQAYESRVGEKEASGNSRGLPLMYVRARALKEQYENLSSDVGTHPEVAKAREQLAHAHEVLNARTLGRNDLTQGQFNREMRRRVNEQAEYAHTDTRHAAQAAQAGLREETHAGLKALKDNPSGARELRQRMKGSRDAVPLVVDATIKNPDSVVEDLKFERDRLKQERGSLDRVKDYAKLRRNAAQIDHIQGLLDNKAFIADPSAAFRAADRFIESQKPLEGKLAEHGSLAEAQAERAKVIPFAIRRMGAHYDWHTDTIRAEDGSPLTTADIHTAMLEDGVRTKNGETPHVGFISQKGDLGKLRDYYRNAFRRPSTAVELSKRTGESSRLGLHSLKYKTVEAQLARTVNMLGAIEHSNKVLDEFGLKPPDDMGWTSAQAAQTAADNATAMNPDQPFTVVHLGSATLQELSAIHEHVNVSDIENHPSGAQLPGSPRYFVVPRVVSKQFDAHAKNIASTSFDLANQALMNSFRRTVLPLSPRWLLGNVAELGVRALVARTGPGSWAMGHHILNRVRLVDPRAYENLTNRAVAGAHIASHDRNSLYTGLERWEDRAGEGLAKRMGTVLRLPAVKQLRGLYNVWTKWIYKITPAFEKQFQTAALGREALNELRDFHGEWYKAIPHWGPAIDDVVHGLIHTDNQIHYGRAIDTIVGRYNKLSPDMRRLVQGYAPFMTWYVNSLRFVYKTMPADHPVLQGILAASYNADEPKRFANREGYFSPDYPGHHQLPGFLQGTIPEGGGAHWPLQHYLPWGAFSDRGSFAGTVLPVYGTALDAWQGNNWKGQPITHPKGMNPTEAAARTALNSIFESLVPMVAIAHRVRQEGGSAYDTSSLVLGVQLRKGTKRSLGAGLKKTFDPLRLYPQGTRVPTGGSGGSSTQPHYGLSYGSSGGDGFKLGGTGSGDGFKLGN